MEHRPSYSASHEIPRTLRNPKDHYHIHISPPPSLYLVRSIQPMPPQTTSLKSILILSSHLRLGLPSGQFHSGFPTKTLHARLLRPTHSLYVINWIILLIRLFERISPSQRLGEVFLNALRLYSKELPPRRQPKLEDNPLSSVRRYSIYSQLPSVLEAFSTCSTLTRFKKIYHFAPDQVLFTLSTWHYRCMNITPSPDTLSYHLQHSANWILHRRGTTKQS